SMRAMSEEIQSTNQTMARLERMMLQTVRRRARRGNHSESSSEGSAESGEDHENRNEFPEDEDVRSRGSNHRGRQRVERPKLTLPTFNGTDPDSWLNRACQYFEINEIPKSERVKYAAYYLDGEANVWWQWLSRVYKKEDKRIRWKNFEKEMIIRFGVSDYHNYNEALSHIKQTGSLREYQKEFERIASRVRDWPEEALVGTFVGGLKTELAAEVRLDKPRTMRAARMRDDHLTALRRANRPEARRPMTFPTNVQRTGSNTSTGNGKDLSTGVKRLSWEEMQRRREKGLCFNCDEKFTPGHRCKERRSFFIECVESEEDEVVGDEVKSAIDLHEEDPEISVHAMAGTQGPKTIKMSAWVRDRRVIVLVDNGSSHNFINSSLSDKLNLQVTKVEPFEVRVANGERLKCSEFYRGVPIKIQGVTLKADLYALPLVGPDVVLGVQWLEGLGPVTTDYRVGTMEFRWSDGMVKLSTGGKEGTKEVSAQ
ncbi:Unknown protein, partial [Striga hermonthica]